jgi:zinc transporter
MDADNGLLFAYVLDGEGGGTKLDWDGIEKWQEADGTLWVHFDRTGNGAEEWVRRESGIEPAAAGTLLMAAGNRPRAERHDNAALVMLRGVNLNKGADPEDMVIIHMWVEAKRIITLRRRNLRAGMKVRDAIETGTGPTDSSSFLRMIIDRLLEPIGEVLEELELRIDNMGQRIFTDAYGVLRRELLEAREEAIMLRRHLAPQRDAMRRLPEEAEALITAEDRSYLREFAERVSRYVDDLDRTRERALMYQDELTNRIAEKTNKTMYVLTVFSALLLPAALLTGLFGINVAGMPWTKSALGFWIILGGLPVLAILEFILLRRLKLI